MNKIINLIKSKLKPKSQKKLQKNPPRYYVCEEIPLSKISKNAIKVIETLKKHNFQAYIVGGGVRDLLLGLKPKDFDIATDAQPEQIKELFKRAQLIGRRFKIVHVCFSGEIIEVSTFRSHGTTSNEKDRLYTSHGFLIRDNIYGTIDEDVYRRDFTINALYYDVTESRLIDYVEGYKDLKAGVIRVIGDPELRYKEDPLRILRAIRLSSKLQMPIDPKTEKPFIEMGHLLNHIPAARLLDELLKIYRSGHALSAMHLLKKHNLFYEIFSFVTLLPKNQSKQRQMTTRMIETTLNNADKRIREEKSLSSGLLFAAFLWYPLQNTLLQRKKSMEDNSYILNVAIHETLHQSMGILALTRKIKLMIREIWLLQYFFTKTKHRQVYYAFQHRYFRNAYHLLSFRIASGEENLIPLFNWWTEFLSATHAEQAHLLEKKPDIL